MVPPLCANVIAPLCTNCPPICNSAEVDENDAGAAAANVRLPRIRIAGAPLVVTVRVHPAFTLNDRTSTLASTTRFWSANPSRTTSSTDVGTPDGDQLRPLFQD